MSYQVIARKWRPQTFEEVTGQEAITRTLRNAVEHERRHHAYIFSGSRGVGKTTTARILAKALNCHKTEEPNPAPCDTGEEDACISCREIAESRSIDVLEFDAASHTGVDDVRELIIENININPARDRFKIFIIDEVHMLSNSSFNALLKTLEEPPPRVQFIMATTELHKIPVTITSRCQEFEFRSIPVKKIFERLKTISAAEKIDITEDALKQIARSGEGSMRDAQSNFDQVISFSGERIDTGDVVTALGIAGTEMLTRTLAAIAGRQPAEILEIVDELISTGRDLRNFARDLLSFFRDLMVVKMAGDTEKLLDTAILSGEELRRHAEPFTETDLIRFFNSLSETETKLRDAAEPRHALEIGLVKLIEMRRVAPIEELLGRMARLEKALTGDGTSKPAPPVGNEDEGAAAAAIAEKKPEKKNPAAELTAEEIPFPVSGSEKTPLTGEKPPPAAAEPSAPASAGPAAGEISKNPPEKKTITANNAPFIPEEMPVRLVPLEAEELEHTEDKWLDAAYEKKLLLSGDDLRLIGRARQFARLLVGGNSDSAPATAKKATGDSKSGSSGGAAFAPAREVPDLVPQIEESDELPELSDDPTDEETRRFAENHPVVKRALRIFRGKIIEVKKIE